jgi:hypothetical protein
MSADLFEFLPFIGGEISRDISDINIIHHNTLRVTATTATTGNTMSTTSTTTA